MAGGLDTWLNENFNKGYSREQLKKFILKFGYSEKQFDESYAKVSAERVSRAKSTLLHKRNPFTVVFLSLVTFGVYALYWFYKTSKEVTEVSGKAPRRYLLWGVAMTIPIILFFWAFMNTAASISTVASDLAIGYASVILLLCGGLGVALLAVFFYTYALSIQPLVEGSLLVHVVYLILLFPGLILMVQVQQKLNAKVDA
jgi:hypothetical protein